MLINNKTSGGEGGGAIRFRPILRAEGEGGGVRFRPILRAGGGGGGGGGGYCPRAYETQGFWTKEGVVNPKNP